MRNILLAFMTLVAALTLAGCGAPVEVPPAHVGKILTKNGYAPNTIKPSKFRLEPCSAYCDRLVLLETNDSRLQERITVFMPDDKLNLEVIVQGTFSISTDPSVVDAIYDRVTADNTDDKSVAIITAKKVYSIYGQQAVRGIVRSEITKYTISEVLDQREAIGQNIHAAIAKKLKSTNTPLVVSRFELADIQPPKVIVEAQQAAKEREIDIQKAEADAQVQLVQAEKDLEIAKKNRLVEREKAEAIAEQNRIAAESITPQLLAYRRLETAERIYSELAKSDNVIIIPADATGFSDLNSDAAVAKLLGKELKGGKK